MERKFTDSELMKALECCKNAECLSCPRWTQEWYSGMCNEFLQDVLDLINRYQAENDRLRSQVNRLKQYDEDRDIRLHARLTKTARVDAIKEFAERLKAKAKVNNLGDGFVYIWEISTLAKEMTEATHEIRKDMADM